MFNELKYKDVVYNNLSEKTRQLLEEKVPKTGTMVIQRNRKPLRVNSYPEGADPRTAMGTPVALIGGQRVKSRADITDPFTKGFVKVVNDLTRTEDGAPVDSDVIFPKGHIVIEIPLDTYHGRQSAAMFFLLEEFKQNILGPNGTSKPQDEYMFEVLDAKGIAEEHSNRQFTAAELKIKLQSLTLDQLRLVARATNYPNASVDEGGEYMKVWVLAQIESSEGILKVQSAFSHLAVLEIEDMLQSAWEKGIIYKDDADKMIRYANNQGGVAGTPIILYDLKTDNQFRHLAEWLVKPDKASQDHLAKIRAMAGLVQQKMEEKIDAMVSRSFNRNDTPPADGPKKERTEKQKANDARFAAAAAERAAKKQAELEENQP